MSTGRRIKQNNSRERKHPKHRKLHCMAIPSFQKIFLPFLQLLSDGKEHEMAKILESMEGHFALSTAEKEELLPSGQSTRMRNRVGWCRTHLAKAGLIERIDWGVYRITDAGTKVLIAPPSRFDLKFLDTIPEHKTWFHTPRGDKPETKTERVTDESPPDERIEEAIEQINDSLAAELQQTMAKMDPFRFEQLVLDLLSKMGYGGSRKEAAKITKKSNDEGIDGIINEDRLGLNVIYVQAKRWQNSVGRKEIQSFVGALAGQQASKGVFITTSAFHQTATDYAEGLAQKVILIDGVRLAQLMIEHDIGVSTSQSFSIKRLDAEYFSEG